MQKFVTFSLFISFLIACSKTDISFSTSKSVSLEARTKELNQDQIDFRSWIEWLFGQPADGSNPLLDADGSNQYNGQPNSSGTLLLAPAPDEGPALRTVTISRSQYQEIFIGFIGFVYWWYDCYKPNGNIQPGSMNLKNLFNGPQKDLSLTINGESKIEYVNRIQSGLWYGYIDPSWEPYCEGHTTTTINADGFAARIPVPNTNGDYIIKATGHTISGKWHVDFPTAVEYTIHVVD